MIPEYANIRFSASCKYWILDAIRVNFEALEALDNDVRAERDRRSQPPVPSPNRRVAASFTGAASQSDSSHPRSSYAPGPASSSSTSASTHTSQVLTPPQSAPSGPAAPRVLGKVIEGPKQIAGHTMLWRAGSKVGAEEFYNQATSIVNIYAIASAPGDFSPDTLTYWTPQLETADQYAQWAKRKAHQQGSIAVIQVAVSEVFTASLRTKYLWYHDDHRGDAWRNLVWHSRRGRGLPRALRQQHIGDPQLMIGHIASGKHVKFVHMDSPDRIRERDLITINIDGAPQEAIQWAFCGTPAKEGFEEQCKDKVWIHVVG